MPMWIGSHFADETKKKNFVAARFLCNFASLDGLFLEMSFQTFVWYSLSGMRTDACIQSGFAVSFSGSVFLSSAFSGSGTGVAVSDSLSHFAISTASLGGMDDRGFDCHRFFGFVRIQDAL